MSDRLFNMGVALLRAAGAVVEVALHEHDLHNVSQELTPAEREAFYLLARTFDRSSPPELARLVKRLGPDEAITRLLTRRLTTADPVEELRAQIDRWDAKGPTRAEGARGE